MDRFVFLCQQRSLGIFFFAKKVVVVVVVVDVVVDVVFVVVVVLNVDCYLGNIKS